MITKNINLKTLNNITDTKSVLELFHTCLCGQSWGFGSQILGCVRKQDYDDAKKLVRQEKGDEYLICMEDVYTKVIEMGRGLYLEDKYSGDKEYFNLETMKEMILNVNLVRLINILNESNYDSIDTDCVLQELIYGEVVFG